MKVLIVEDDIALGKMLKDFLEKMERHSVHHIASGREAMEVINRESFDCAFIDLQLNDISGIDILRYLKSVDPAVPVIMMSGYPTLEGSIEAMRLGACDFLTKPFSLQDVMVSFERAFRERQILLENLALKLEHETRLELERVNRELERRIEEQRILFSVSRHLDEVTSSEALYDAILSWALELTGADSVGLYISLPAGQPSGGDLVLVAEKNRGKGENFLPALIRSVDGIGGVGLNASGAVQRACQGMSGHVSGWFHEEVILRALPVDSCKIWQLKIRGELFAYLTAYFHGGVRPVQKMSARILDFLLKKAGLTLENLALYESLMANFYAILRSLVNALEARDVYTGKHSERVTRWAVKIAQYMGCKRTDVEALRTVGYLHDIGKIGIPDAILNKPGKLSVEEYDLIKQHPVIGETIVKELGLSDEERSIIRHHHERWDGKGYPDGIGGTDIPLVARIICVADAYDAMSTDRPYRKALSRERIISEFRGNKGTQFDPDVVDAILDLLGSREEDNER
ncbi:HD domain-containing phosphohydrolase [Thermodesulforhabdus norvegica]|uniref:HDIG domain-containing protein n=1 Tax=Thermodesulforhabdus norvegica TaxID=39841 RepID=A0A1I4QT17_9BACT|nr:HD domain-containing phosphohydrolase [Thermodesulforhabdus norvegica]SFM42870.1 HDIG domain-containing protein [Thermodesulforhabdus norvegica]